MGNRSAEMDLEVISRRILDLAQVAVEEHVASIGRSQADGLMERIAEMDAEECPVVGRWRS